MAKGKYYELCVRSQKHYRAPEWSRTIDLQNRNLSLYPAELRAHGMTRFGAGNEARTRDLNLGKVALYQLSYSRRGESIRVICWGCH